MTLRVTLRVTVKEIENVTVAETLRDWWRKLRGSEGDGRKDVKIVSEGEIDKDSDGKKIGE